MRGYRAASTAAIATAAGVPQPHVYASFRTKRDLFLACSQRVVEAITAAADGRCEASVESDIPEHLVWRLFILQAISALPEESLTAELQPLLSQLKVELGEQEFGALVLHATHTLMNQPL